MRVLIQPVQAQTCLLKAEWQKYPWEIKNRDHQKWEISMQKGNKNNKIKWKLRIKNQGPKCIKNGTLKETLLKWVYWLKDYGNDRGN